MNTNASNQTQYFGFPLFAGTDKPSVLTDWNGTMEELDNTLEDYRVRIAGCEQTTASFMDQVNILKTKFTEIEARLSADEGLIQDNALEIVAIKDALIIADTSIKGLLQRMASVESSMTSISTTVGNLALDIAGHTTQISNLDSREIALENRVSTAESNLSQVQADVSGIENSISTITSTLDQLGLTVSEISSNLASVSADATYSKRMVSGLIKDTQSHTIYFDYSNHNSGEPYRYSISDFESVGVPDKSVLVLDGFSIYGTLTSTSPNYDNYLDNPFRPFEQQDLEVNVNFFPSQGDGLAFTRKAYLKKVDQWDIGGTGNRRFYFEFDNPINIPDGGTHGILWVYVPEINSSTGAFKIDAKNSVASFNLAGGNSGTDKGSIHFTCEL